MDNVFYQNAYPATAVVYGLYPTRDLEPANLAPLKDGDLNCLTQWVVEHFDDTLRGYGLTPKRFQEWEKRFRRLWRVYDVAKLESILQRAITLRDITGADICNSGKYQRHGNKTYSKIELIVHNGHAWSSELHFPQSREVHIYEGNVSDAIREATRDEPVMAWLLVLGVKTVCSRSIS